MTAAQSHVDPASDTVAVRAHELRVAVKNVAHSLRREGLFGPAEAYQVIGELCILSTITREVTSGVAAWLAQAQREGRLTVGEGPFIDEPEAAVVVVTEALAGAAAACTRAHAELERAHIAAVDIGAARQLSTRPGRGEL